MTDIVDILIVGGGVAGSALGGTLAGTGMRVSIIEREPVFRDRVRGEGLHPWGVAEVVRLGVMPQLLASGANELPIWQEYVDGVPESPYRWSDDSIDGCSEYGVSHPRIQQTLIEWAERSGAIVVRPATAIGLASGTTVNVRTPSGNRTFQTRLVVGADGRRSRVARWIGSTLVEDPVHHRFGGALFDEVELDSHAAHDARFAGGRVFALPQGEGRVRIYLVLSEERWNERGPAKSAEAFLRVCTEHLPAAPLARARQAGPIAFFPNADIWQTKVTAPGFVLIGDAAGANDPSVGHGLSIAFRDVRELRDVLLHHTDWEDALHVYAERRLRYYEVLRHHAHWLALLTTDQGDEADLRRQRVLEAREKDPSAGGFGLIFGQGPDGLTVDSGARSRFFGANDAPAW